MYYTRQGQIATNVIPNHRDRQPFVEYASRKAKPLLLRLSRCLVWDESYDLLIGRGGEKGRIAIRFGPEGEYQVKMKPEVCELRLAAFIGVRNGNYQAPFELGRRVLVVQLPKARHEKESWWGKVPPVSDNPGDALRELAKMHQM